MRLSFRKFVEKIMYVIAHSLYWLAEIQRLVSNAETA